MISRVVEHGSRSLTVVAEDDYYKYYADSIVAYTFMLSMIFLISGQRLFLYIYVGEYKMTQKKGKAFVDKIFHLFTDRFSFYIYLQIVILLS